MLGSEETAPKGDDIAFIEGADVLTVGALTAGGLVDWSTDGADGMSFVGGLTGASPST